MFVIIEPQNTFNDFVATTAVDDNFKHKICFNYFHIFHILDVTVIKFLVLFLETIVSTGGILSGIHFACSLLVSPIRQHLPSTADVPHTLRARRYKRR